MSLCDAIAVLLETWNGSYFRFNPKARLILLSKIDTLLKTHNRHIDEIRQRTIEEFSNNDVELVKTMFNDFEKALGKNRYCQNAFIYWHRAFSLFGMLR